MSVHETDMTVGGMRHVRRIHFVGIGGAGMCGIAEVLLNLGYEVSGSDIAQSSVTDRLVQLGAKVSIGHDAENIGLCDVLVVSSAVPGSNPEIGEAESRRLPIVSRAEMLGELMRHRYGIAVAGTHGKTTTTSLITSIFQEAGLDPTFVIGGLLKSVGRHAGLGRSKYLIAEADESDGSFLYLHPMLAVVTNIDRDHMETYDHDFGLLCTAFGEFVRRLPFYGAVVVCLDDENVHNLLDEFARPVITYGISPEADYRAVDIEQHDRVWQFKALRPDGMPPLAISLHMPGFQNVRNALAAIAVASDQGIDEEAIERGIGQFTGVHRRFEISDIRVRDKSVPVVDDYGHHPTEVRYVLESARLVWPNRGIFMVYQPHRFTRTRDLFTEFVDVLATVDRLLVLDTYAASENEIADANARTLCKAIAERNSASVVFAKDPADAAATIQEHLQDNDVLMIQGAGNVNQVLDRLRECAA